MESQSHLNRHGCNEDMFGNPGLRCIKVGLTSNLRSVGLIADHLGFEAVPQIWRQPPISRPFPASTIKTYRMPHSRVRGAVHG